MRVAALADWHRRLFSGTTDWRRHWRYLLLLATLWTTLSWYLADYQATQNVQHMIASERRHALRLSENTARNIKETLNRHRGGAVVLAREASLRNALQRRDIQHLGNDLRWLHQDRALADINRYLRVVAESLGVDLLFVLNASGTCIASSTAQPDRDPVGHNYLPRDYFQAARAGQSGTQFAVGSLSRTPGVFLSIPVMLDEGFVGAVVAKIDIASFSPLLSQADTLLSDNYGAIVLAHDKAMEYHTLPEQTVSTLSAEARRLRYGRDELPLLAWQALPHPADKDLLNIEGIAEPALAVRQDIEGGWLTVTMLRRLPGLARYDRERLRDFLILAGSGLLVLLASAYALAYRRAQRNAWQELSAQTLRLDHAQRIARVGSWQRRSLADPVLWSAEVFRIFEMPAGSTMIGEEQFRQRVHPDDLDALMHAYETLFAEEHPYELHHRLLLPQGRIKHLIQHGEVVRDESGQTQWFIGTIQDITDRLQMETALHDSQEIYRAVFDSATDGLVIIDAETGRITACNDAATALLAAGHAPAPVGQTLQHYAPAFQPGGESSAQLMAFHLVKCCTDGKDDFEWEMRRSNAETRSLLISLCSVHLQGDTCLLASLRDISQRKQLENRLVQLAHTDALTGLYNRRRFVEIAEQELLRCRRYRSPLALCMLDVDHFKQINDTYGHKAGDIVLQRMKALCLDVLRETDIVGRIGGEEFAMLLPETHSRQALMVAERLRRHIAETPIVIDNDLHLVITVSIGVAALENGATTLDALFGEADTQLYAAKSNGRNRVFPPPMPPL